MSRRRFFAPPDAFKQRTVTLTFDEAKHLRDVLRLKQGDEVYVFDGAGKEFRCIVSSWKRDEVSLDECELVSPPHPESPVDLTLAVALLKGDKFDLVVQKVTELGVTRIVPVMTRHADIHLRDTSDAAKRVNRWRRIALEAAKQCGRARVPDVDMPASFAELLASANRSLRVMFSEREGRSFESLIADSVSQERQANAYRTPDAVTALVGSEGGWADDEIKTAMDSGWHIVTLGGRILRAETAAITVSVLLQHAFGDLR
jgi:16S rRNA (uracil1498-N3)-methyltransferase